VKLFRRTQEKNLLHAYLGNNIITVPDKLESTASLIMKMTGDSLFAIDSTHYIKRGTVSPQFL
jgi:hypothetical protein